MSRIVAHFKSMHDAKETVNQLEKANFFGAYLDAHDSYKNEFAAEPIYGEIDITSTFSSNLYKNVKDLHGRAQKALKNSSLPIYTDHVGDAASEINTRLIIKTDNGNDKQVETIIESSGGIIMR
jgi:hypothetical protein